MYTWKETGRRVCKAGLLCPFLSGLLVVRKWSVLNTIAKMSRCRRLCCGIDNEGKLHRIQQNKVSQPFGATLSRPTRRRKIERPPLCVMYFGWCKKDAEVILPV